MKKIALAIILATSAFAEEEFVAYKVSEKGNTTIVTICAVPLTNDRMKQILPPFINLLGDGMVAYDGEKTENTLEAKLLAHTDYQLIDEKEGNQKLTDWLLGSLDERVAPIFTKLAEKVRENSAKQKMEYLERAKILLENNSINAECWCLPTGYALAEEIKITLNNKPRKIAVIYKQNIYGVVHKREKVFMLQDEYSICLAQQKKIEEAIKQYNLTENGYYEMTGEKGTGGFLGMLKHAGLLEKSVEEKSGGAYFSDINGNIWCARHMPALLNPEIVKNKCAWQQRMISKYLYAEWLGTKKYPNLANKTEFETFVKEWNCQKLFCEPAGSSYSIDSSQEIFCTMHGKLR